MKQQLRIATLVLSATGVLFNTFVIISQLVLLRRAFIDEPVLEREGTLDHYIVHAGLALWGLSFLYFITSAGTCLVAFVATIERCPDRLRAVRQACFIDVSFFAVALLAISLYSGSRSPELQSFLCEELPRPPHLIFGVNAGLSYESCEIWTERRLASTATIMTLMIIVKLQYVLTINSYRSQLLRSQIKDENEFIVYVPVYVVTDESREMCAREARLLPPGSSIRNTFHNFGHPYPPVRFERLNVEEKMVHFEM